MKQKSLADKFRSYSEMIRWLENQGIKYCIDNSYSIFIRKESWVRLTEWIDESKQGRVFCFHPDNGDQFNAYNPQIHGRKIDIWNELYCLVSGIELFDPLNSDEWFFTISDLINRKILQPDDPE